MLNLICEQVMKRPAMKKPAAIIKAEPAESQDKPDETHTQTTCWVSCFEYTVNNITKACFVLPHVCV